MRMHFAMACAILCWGLVGNELAVLPATAGEVDAKLGVRRVGSEPLVFVDRTFLTEESNVRLRLHQPQKTGEKLLVSDQPWENATLNWFSVLRDQGVYRMWYECYDVAGWPTADDTSFCYAESPDGVHWSKPQLGLFTYQGSAANNIMFRQVGTGSYRSRVHGSGVFVDPTAPPATRYKCVSQGMFQGVGERPYYVAGMSSPDGLRWTRHPVPICRVFADSQYSGLWDPLLGEYVLMGRVGGRGGRAIGRTTSDRFSSFPPLGQPVLQTDASDATDCDLYNPACQIYPGVAGLYLMFPSFFRHREDTLEIRLAVSRDGVHWTWPDRETPLIPLGGPGAFDRGSLYFANGGCVPTGDNWSLYYSGSPLKHGEVDLPQLTDPRNRRSYSRAVLRPDRLVSVSAANQPGRFQTPRLHYSGTRLTVNATVQSGGRIRIGMRRSDGSAIPGRGIEDCLPITGEGVSLLVAWTSGADVSAWSGEPCRLEFELIDADLFACRFDASEPGGR